MVGTTDALKTSGGKTSMNQLREIHTCAFVSYPYERVSEVLRRDPVGLIQRANVHAVSRARELVSTLPESLGGVEVDQEFIVELTSVAEETEVMLGPRTRLCLSWRASRHPHLLPTMDATLDVLTLGPREAQLDFVGKYRPAHGMVGAAVDKAIGHRILDAAAHRFVESIAERLRMDARE
jgi:hypothetical protein